jgi:glycosyltransferase involved in cell wall biosynthesis
MTSESQVQITVFTPTYNRASLLPRLYQSLAAQTFRGFEWIIVDDGSTDETRQLVESWKSSAPFPIRYFWQPNGGKHTAINVGVREAHGRFFCSIDSDDRYVPQTLERFLFHWETIPVAQRDQFVAVCGLDAYESGEIVGTRFPQDVLDSNDIDIRIKYRVKGDKISMMRTDVMREFPFPEDLGRFVTEGIVWNRIGRKYQTRFVNHVFAIIEYQRGGLTDKSRLLQALNAKSNLVYLHELITSGKTFPMGFIVKAYSNYIRYSLHERVSLIHARCQVPARWLFSLCVPIGLILHKRDLRLLRDEKRQN